MTGRRVRLRRDGVGRSGRRQRIELRDDVSQVIFNGKRVGNLFCRRGAVGGVHGDARVEIVGTA